jgi:hypothetical protein
MRILFFLPHAIVDVSTEIQWDRLYGHSVDPRNGDLALLAYGSYDGQQPRPHKVEGHRVGSGNTSTRQPDKGTSVVAPSLV